MRSILKRSPFLIRLLNWEYWPFAVVYGPILPVYFWYSLRARSFFFFSTSNPTIKNAGFQMESKYEIDAIVPQQFRPASIYFEPFTEVTKIKYRLVQHQFNYPLIIKPDIGGRGMGVKKVSSDEELQVAVTGFPVPFIVQPFIPLPNEIGLFYVKIPGHASGQITGIVRKEFLKVTGDGQHSILELLQQNNRHILQISALKKTLSTDINRVIPSGTTEILVPYGNHSRGSLFLDDSHLISPGLIKTFNTICSQIPGFNFGRMDIRYNSWEELEQGKNFSIIELNGAGSEPTHIYDPRHSIFFAWKEIIRHWQFLFRVSKKNRDLLQLSYMKHSEGMRMFKENKLYNKKCSAAFL
jgi:hypothetical protein